jgi:spore maturation protein CgeB
MKIVIFCHAFTSCWNNGNAHFLRGVARELVRVGHQVTICEPADGWSRTQAIRDGGESYLSEAASLLPAVSICQYEEPLDLEEILEGAALVIVHEWNPAALIGRIGQLHAGGARFTLLFHDTHHRAISAPDELAAFDLSGYDGVLAFGEVLRDIYVKRGWARQAFVWHEAADVELYKPLPDVEKTEDVVWVGNWGDDERSAELKEFLIDPIGELKLSATIYGVRYPDEAINAIAASGIRYGGWLPNDKAPLAFAHARATVHVPRGPYARMLPGIPTIRVFEALACGTPLVSAPWSDAEWLFPTGSYLSVDSRAAMKAALWDVLNDGDLAGTLIRNGLDVISSRHTCRHRAQELLAIADRLSGAEGFGRISRSERVA